MDVLPRVEEGRLRRRLATVPAVALIGPRQVGKTTLVRSLLSEWPHPTTYLDLERPSDLARLSDSELFLSSVADHTVVLDEVQRMPTLFPLLRSLIDEGRRPGRFLLLGSAAPPLLRDASESLAGRISYLELPPFRLAEVGADRFEDHWVRGGFPQSFLAPEEETRRQWWDDFLRSYLERDLPTLGLATSPRLVRRLLTMVAGAQGAPLNASTLANSLGISQPTVQNTLDFLEHAFLIHYLPPYFVNVGKRLVKSPRVYLRDAGMVHHLLGLHDLPGVLGHVVAGGSWEGYVVQEVITQLPSGVTPHYYRTSNGAELDLILERNGRPVLAIEAKLSSQPKMQRGNTVALRDVGDVPLWVVNPSDAFYPLRPNVWLCGIKRLAEQMSAFFG